MDFVIAVHDQIIEEIGGLPGLAGGGRGAVQAALNRIEMRRTYEALNDVFGIAGHYAEAIARGHVFNDGNKRTALTCALTYLEEEGIEIPEVDVIDEVMVMLADGDLSATEFSNFLFSVWRAHNRPRSMPQ
ncbi:type II toxin-antitoxin system death-on-curing family toxin [Pigmentiphaga litoralis]|uniref:type II toxin-antitoxin system death-on-curing family toxin n=1 Tax=Pigmentiphaga litoralis TaxID=516702 RepID=UPI003B42BF2D